MLNVELGESLQMAALSLTENTGVTEKEQKGLGIRRLRAVTSGKKGPRGLGFEEGGDVHEILTNSHPSF